VVGSWGDGSNFGQVLGTSTLHGFWLNWHAVVDGWDVVAKSAIVRHGLVFHMVMGGDMASGLSESGKVFGTSLLHFEGLNRQMVGNDHCEQQRRKNLKS
jgi:hypothetical protein